MKHVGDDKPGEGMDVSPEAALPEVAVPSLGPQK